MKKSQVTIFIVMGMIIILFLSIFIYLKTSTTFFTPEKILPAEFVPVKRFVEQCTDILARDAVFLASMQAGYVELPPEIDNDPFSYVGEGLKIPLWLYNGQDRMPKKEDIENNIASHIDSNLRGCLNGFEGFEEEFDIEELGNPKTTISISDNSIFVKTNFPLEIRNKQGTEKTEWRDYVTTFSDSLGKKYKLASAIMDYENEHAFLENLTMEMIAASDFPNEGLELTCGKRSYHIDEDILPALKLMLLANMRYVTFENTETQELPTPYHEKLYRFTVSHEDFPNIRVDTIFNRNLNFNLNVYPEKNRIVEPVNFDLPVIDTCLKIYNHKYDIYYPVTFQISEQTEPSYFFFATPVIIDNSMPNRIYGVRPQLIDDTLRVREYCENKEFPLTVYAIDEFTNQYINDVDIRFQCIRFICDMGKTSVRLTEDDLVIDPGDFVLEKEFPTCGGGFIIAEKQGYMRGIKEDVLTGEITVTGQTKLYEGYQANVYMTPLKTIDYRVRVIEFNETTPKTRALKDNETVIITLTNDEKEYRETLVFPFEYVLFNNLTLMVGDYTYNIDIKLIENENFVGGLIGNWTTSGNSVYGAERVDFYVIKDVESPALETEYADLMDIIRSASPNYMPRLR